MIPLLGIVNAAVFSLMFLIPGARPAPFSTTRQPFEAVDAPCARSQCIFRECPDEASFTQRVGFLPVKVQPASGNGVPQRGR